MKKLIYLSLIISVGLLSCEQSPEANFDTETNNPVVGHEVLFTNHSHNANSFEWDFGDGYISNDPNPGHVYKSTGTFEVTLIATSKNGLDDKASLTLKVVIPTLLEIEVREFYDEYVVEGASVLLYPTITDWDAQTNSLIEGFTDKYGTVVFSDLDPFVYYVDVWEKEHDNYALRDEDIGFVRTDEVLPNRINRFIAWVDYVDRGKGVARGTRTAVIKKLERVAADKKNINSASETEGWEDLYNRSVKIK